MLPVAVEARKTELEYAASCEGSWSGAQILGSGSGGERREMAVLLEPGGKILRSTGAVEGVRRQVERLQVSQMVEAGGTWVNQGIMGEVEVVELRESFRRRLDE